MAAVVKLIQEMRVRVGKWAEETKKNQAGLMCAGRWKTCKLHYLTLKTHSDSTLARHSTMYVLIIYLNDHFYCNCIRFWWIHPLLRSKKHGPIQWLYTCFTGDCGTVKCDQITANLKRRSNQKTAERQWVVCKMFGTMARN